MESGGAPLPHGAERAALHVRNNKTRIIPLYAITPTEQPSVLDKNTSVHHYRKPGIFRFFLCVFVYNSKLHPHRPRTHGDGFVNDRHHFRGVTEYVHDVYLFRYAAQIGIAFFPQHLLICRVNRDNIVSFLYQVFHDAVAIAPRFVAGTHNGDGLCRLKQCFKFLVVHFATKKERRVSLAFSWFYIFKSAYPLYAMFTLRAASASSSRRTGVV